MSWMEEFPQNFIERFKEYSIGAKNTKLILLRRGKFNPFINVKFYSPEGSRSKRFFKA